MAYLRGEKETTFFPLLCGYLSLTMAERCEGHIFVNVREEASSKTMINAYAKLQCRVFFPYDELCTGMQKLWGFCCHGIFHTIYTDVQKNQNHRSP